MAPTRKVVLIMTDTQRKDMLGCYGNKELKTSSLDKLASQGVRFENGYCCQPVCGPARAALFTGTYPHSNGSWSNSQAVGDNVHTIGQRLQREGIHTAYVGKWHLDGSDYFGLGECPDGWDPDYWYDMKNYLDELTPEERLKSRDQFTNQDPGNPAAFTYGNRCSNRGVDFLEKHGAEDFFLTVSYDEPHHPFLCPEPYASMYKDYKHPKSKNIWDTLEGKPEHQQAWSGDKVNSDKDALEITNQNFFGCNSYVDHEIGRVLEAVEKHAPDALVIYTSDHGDLLHSHSLLGKGAAMYDEITNVPFIIKWPGAAPAGSVSETPVSHIDLMPTVMAAMGLELPNVLEGDDLAPVLNSPETAGNRKVFMEFNRYEIDHDSFGGFQPIRSVFDGRYKLVINLLSSDELYDHESDPEEMHNLIASEDQVKIRNALHDAILNWMNDTRDPFRGYYWERRPWRIDARPATWDYTGMTRQREEPTEPRQLTYETGLAMEKAVRPK